MDNTEWWFNNSGQNLLKGIEGDTENPPMLEADMIQDFFARIPASVVSYQRIRPMLLIEEQERCDDLLRSSIIFQKLANSQGWLDQAMQRHNTAGIHMGGPRR